MAGNGQEINQITDGTQKYWEEDIADEIKRNKRHTHRSSYVAVPSLHPSKYPLDFT